MLRFLAALSLASLLPADTAAGQPAGSPRPGVAGCAPTPPATGAPAEILGRVATAIGLPHQAGRVLHLRSWSHTVNDYQSDRSYPPYFSAFQTTETWLDPIRGGLATRGLGGGFPGSEFPRAPVTQLSGPWGSWVVRDTTAGPAGSGAEGRAMNPWAIVRDYLAGAGEVRLEGRCRYRDYPRLVLTRAGVFGPERLLVDPKTMVPVALLREEPHYLFGQVTAEYVWSNWDPVEGGGIYPATAFRQLDGATLVSVTTTAKDLAPPDSAPRLALPDSTFRGPALLAAFVQPARPDTVRVSNDTWLLVNPAYTIAVTLLRDTVFVLDATLSEARARQDAEWIGTLFPGRHPVVVVVTDLAYPHIGGVRYWVAQGATIVSHRASRAFLERVVERRWTRAPDLLERRRAGARLRFRAVDDSLRLAGGDLVLHAIDGIASEGALVGWLPRDRFLWASDYIQNTRAPSQYALEVLRAVRRGKLGPERFAAQHVRLTPWSTIESLHPGETP